MNKKYDLLQEREKIEERMISCCYRFEGPKDELSDSLIDSLVDEISSLVSEHKRISIKLNCLDFR